jgi:hypothetical protein
MFLELLEKTKQVNEVNIPARLAADDLISSFSDAFQAWQDTYMEQLSPEDYRLTMKMIWSTPFRTFIKREDN